ncbi:unnamed protein product [Closterium sp. NIES-64]|nr:unnamed protein product [Closterium sp. NIES-64]CAI6008459.1 unnamed protein product [Closterium sp. NIES-65]
MSKAFQTWWGPENAKSWGGGGGTVQSPHRGEPSILSSFLVSRVSNTQVRPMASPTCPPPAMPSPYRGLSLDEPPPPVCVAAPLPPSLPSPPPPPPFPPSPSSHFSPSPRATTRHQIRLQVPNGKYVRAGGVYTGINAKFPTLDLTPKADRTTIFTIVSAGADTINLLAYDGKYVSASGNKGDQLLRWATSPSEWEAFVVFEAMMVPAIRGANVGGWLVYERWMNPGLYSTPRKWKDGTMFRLQSMTTKKYVTAKNYGGSTIICKDSTPGYDGIFFLRTNGAKYQVRVQGTQYWALSGSSVVAGSPNPTKKYSDFSFQFKDSSLSLVRVVAANGKMLRATASGDLVADGTSTSWSGDTAFAVTITGTRDDEWQLSASLGPSKVTPYMSSFRTAFLTEADFRYMRRQGLNAARIPIPYWVMQDPKPEYPWAAGTRERLDWAFTMGRKYGIRIWLSLHVLPGTQSGTYGSRDSLTLWPLAANYQKSLQLVEWLGKRYGGKSEFLGIGLVNEPAAPWAYGVQSGVSLPLLKKYYSAGYKALRKGAKCAFMSMEGRIGSNIWEVHWHLYDNIHTNVILESHLYNVFNPELVNNKKMTAAQEVEYTRTTMPAKLRDYQQFGRPVLVGEFSNAMAHPDDSYQAAFSKAQLQAFATAQAGWFFWSLKHNISLGYEHWSFVKSREKGWLPQKSPGVWW